MTFALSGSVITQSSTDTTLAGLSGIAGVVTLTRGVKTVYDIGAKNLIVSGTLTMDPRFEELCIGSGPWPQIGVGNGGTFNIGVDITVNSVPFYPPTTAIYCNQVAKTGYDATQGALNISGSGVVNHRYGTIFHYGALNMGDTANSASGTYKSYSQSAAFVGLGANSDGQKGQIRIYSTQTDINGLLVHNHQAATLICNPTRIKGLKPYHGVAGVSYSNSAPSSTWLALEDADFSGGNTGDVGFSAGKWGLLINASKGSDCNSRSLSSGPFNNYGLLEIRSNLAVTAKKTDGAFVTTGGIFVRDKNNGNRTAGDASSNIPAYTSDRTYAASFNGSGVASYTTDGGILLAVHHRLIANEDGSVNNATVNATDKRGEANDATDVFFIRSRSYGLLFSETSAALKGARGFAQAVTLFANTAVVQASATALAHTGITLTDHGGSPVAWNSKSWGITVTGNLSTNPALTAADIYHYLQYHLSQVGTTFNSKVGGEWHEMLKPAGAGYATETGTYSGLRTVKGVRVVDQSGNAFPGITYMTADDGTTYTPPVAVILTLSANVSLLGAEVRIYDLDNLPAGSLGTELGGTESCAGATFQYTGSAGNSLWVQIMAPGYEEFGQSLVMPSTSAGFIATLQPDASA